MKFKKIISLTLTLAFSLSSLSAFAEFDSQTGKYTDTHNVEEMQETEEMYKNRPFNLRRAEYLTRGLSAIPSDSGVLISWRFLGTDSINLKYNLYRGDTLLNTFPLSLTNYFDTDGKGGDTYTLVEVENGKETDIKTSVTEWEKNYLEFKLIERSDYIIDDGGTGDLDGDGEFEYLIRRTPKDMAPSTRTVYPLIEAYETNGEHMWTINIGPNEINEHDINFMAYDFNNDGKNEVILRSFEGTIDGTGYTIPDTDGDGITDYSLDESNLAIFKDRQYIVKKPEFISMYDGETGKELARTDMLPAMEPLQNWSYKYSDTGRLTKRASHYLWGVAFLDGKTPSIVNVRGAWDNVNIAAWHIEDNKFVLDWETDTPNEDNLNTIWGALNHNMATADIDFDGKDEIFSGPMAVDDDGTTMYATTAAADDGVSVKLAHGDAFDMAIMSPDFNGYLSWACHETKNLPANIELHDGRTGQVIWGYTKPKDTGRSRAADIDPNYRGFEVWGSTQTIPSNISGEELSDQWNKFKTKKNGAYETDADGRVITSSLPMNFKIYWDGDLLSELLDGTRISKWDYENKEISVLLDAEGCLSNSGTKAVPCVSADLFGDWREEVVFKTEDDQGIRVYATTSQTPYKIHSLMHDSAYRAAIATQNNHYNQPPNVSYYLGWETTKIPYPEITVTKNGETIKNPDLKNEHLSYNILCEDAEIKDINLSTTQNGYAVNLETTALNNEIILIAVYDTNGVLSYSTFRESTDETTYTFNIPKSDTEFGMVKAFIWSTLKEMKPVCYPKIY